MHFFDDLKWRGLVQDVSDEQAVRALKAGDRFYVGFDPTAPSLQLGNLIPLLTAIRLGQAGLKPFLLFGGATGSIGDPSGRSSERVLLSLEAVAENIKTMSATAATICARLRVVPTFVNNYEWTKSIPVLDFLRDVGKHFTVNYMISKEVVKTRLEGDGISYTEFSYMLLQAFDFLHLYQHEGCTLQLGGSDQWGNLTAGLELIRRKVQGNACAFSWPLLLNSQGKKFGKSEGGALWLNSTMTSPYKLHQFFLNSDDRDVIKLLKIFTFLSHEQITALEQSVTTAPEKREAQKLLADELCTIVHGAEATAEAKRSAEVLFGGSLEGLSPRQLEEIFSDVPSSKLPRSAAQGLLLIDLLVQAGLVKSKGEARRLLTSGGVYLNNERASDPQGTVEQAASASPFIVLRTGKKNYHLVRIEG